MAHFFDDQFSEEYDQNTPVIPSKFLIIAYTGRSGSNMLGHALQKTNSFGYPLEYSNPVYLAEWKRRLGKDSLVDVIQELQKRRTSPSGVFAIKINYHHIQQYGGFDGVKKMFPDAYYILLSRENIVRQAISRFIALQTGVWLAGMKSRDTELQYNFDHIDGCLRSIILETASWRYTLAANGCNFIEMSFDTILRNLTGSIQKIANFMDIGIDPSTIPTEHVTKKQSKSLNEEWEKRYLSDFKENELLKDHRKKLSSRIKRKFRLILNR